MSVLQIPFLLPNCRLLSTSSECYTNCKIGITVKGILMRSKTITRIRMSNQPGTNSQVDTVKSQPVMEEDTTEVDIMVVDTVKMNMK
jgi:hypothetical protein